MDKLIEIAATILTLLGFWYISEGNINGFTISLISNILWVIWGTEKKAFALVGLNVTLLIINLNGLNIL